MGRRAPVGFVAMLVVGLVLTVNVGDPPSAAATTISAPSGAIGGCVADWTIDAPEFDAPAGLVLDAPTVVVVDAAPLQPLAGAAPRAHLLRLAPKTSPPGSLVPGPPPHEEIS